ncbi:MAG TPA: DUF2339 domain-containing protein, partial [Thermoanaerobaculia bacterium]|nr:DUF2339 domain-containing protein [Thermoanaerobaculia bacterium]
MATFLALVVSIIALAVAVKARSDLKDFRDELANVGRASARPGPEGRAEARPTSGPGGRAEARPTSEPVIPIYQPPPPVPPRPPAPPTPPPAAPPSFSPPPPPAPPRAPHVPLPSAQPPIWQRIDWESFVGVKLFSWVAGIALVIAAIYFLKYSVEHGWVRPPVRAAIGLITGSVLLVVCELRVARGYKFTANAMLGAGIAILYATLFAVHALWHLLPAMVVFGGMIIVTAVAVLLSIRRESPFIALLGMLGGFATPALLSTGENRPIGLFSYLLLLNAGLAWVAYKKRWPLLTIGSVAFSIIYQW